VKRRNVYLAIDSENLLYSLDNNQHVDYEAAMNLARRLGTIVESAIYTSRGNGLEKEKDMLIDVKRMGYTRVISRPHRCRPDGTRKSDIDIAMTVDIWEAALRKRMDTLILVSGDSDFIPLVERLVQQGLEVYVIGPEGALAWELAIASTQFCHASEVAGLLQEAIVDQPTLVQSAALAA
jgi:uncharacterized LabA/DUF88 family protein